MSDEDGKQGRPEGPGDDPAERERSRAAKARQKVRERVFALRDVEGQSPEFAKTLTEQRVDAVLGLMCDGLYISGKTDRELMREWGVSLDRVQHITCEANRWLRRLMCEASGQEKQDLLAQFKQSMLRIASESEESATPRGREVAIKAWTELLTYLGHKPDPKVSVSLEDQAKEFFVFLEQKLGREAFLKVAEEWRNRGAQREDPELPPAGAEPPAPGAPSAPPEQGGSAEPLPPEPAPESS